MIHRKAAFLVFAFVLLLAMPASADTCKGGRDSQSAMWFSILHPGLGEWYLNGWGPISNAPQRKFWLGFIPFYGWPGYLQIKSAQDAARCETNDEL